MPLFIWSDALATGNSFMDDEHHLLVERVDAVLEAIAKGRASALLRSAINDLVVYTRAHFGQEEAHMQRIHFAGLEAHKEDHANLLKQLDALQQDLDAGSHISAMDLYNFLTRWVKNHIVNFDTQLAAALKEAPG
jgi:hemerythrin-like metal-binding protein